MRGGAAIRRVLDVARMAEAVSRPGIDPRIWASYAIVDDDPRAISVERGGVFVDVHLQPSMIPCVALLGQAHSAPGAGDYRPVRRGDLVFVTIPTGDPNAGAVLTRRCANAIDTTPATVNGRTNDGSFGYDVVDADVEEQSTTGQWRRRAATIAALDGRATDGVRLGFAATERVIRGDAYAAAESAFLTALNTFAVAVGAAVGTIPGGAAAGAAIGTAAGVLANAATAFTNAVTAALSAKVRTE